MTQHTNHRAEATAALAAAEETQLKTSTFAEEGILTALVGIGHALLALHQPQPQGEGVPRKQASTPATPSAPEIGSLRNPRPARGEN